MFDWLPRAVDTQGGNYLGMGESECYRGEEKESWQSYANEFGG